MRRARIALRLIAVALVVGFAWQRIAGALSYPFADTGRLAAYGTTGFGAQCLGIDLDGDPAGSRAVEQWPADVVVDIGGGRVLDRSNRVIAVLGDRVRVSGLFVRHHLDIDPCDAAERLALDSFASVGRPEPTPAP